MKKKDLKCCGNCKYRNREDYGYAQIENCPYETLPSWGICSKWEYDGFNIYSRHQSYRCKIKR